MSRAGQLLGDRDEGDVGGCVAGAMRVRADDVSADDIEAQEAEKEHVCVLTSDHLRRDSGVGAEKVEDEEAVEAVNDVLNSDTARAPAVAGM